MDSRLAKGELGPCFILTRIIAQRDHHRLMGPQLARRKKIFVCPAWGALVLTNQMQSFYPVIIIE